MLDANRPSPTERVARGLPLLVAVSGGAALVYQLLWMRSFGLIFGTTTDAVAMVLAVFMGGLALGSALAARRPSADPLRVYGVVEIGIGATALLSLPLLRALPWAYGALEGLEGPVEMGGRVVLASIVLLPATVMLGMTIPLAVEVLTRAGRPVRASFGRLYLLNTLGGAAGVALAPFLLVPVLGVRGALMAAAAGSLAVGGLALYWRREVTLSAEPAPRTEEAADEGRLSASPLPPEDERARRMLVAGLAAVLGAATFGIVVLLTRSYALVIGSSVYAFNLMFLAVLLGIAGGAFVYGRVRGRIQHPTRVVGLLFTSAAVAVLAVQWVIGSLPVAYLAALDVLPVSFVAHQLAGLVLCLATMLPVTLVLGLTFPLLLHLADVDRSSAQQASGRLYAWNTAGAIVGTVAAGLLLVPWLGLQPSYLVFAALLLGGGARALAEAAAWRPLVRTLVPVGLVLVLFVVSPRWTPWDPVLMSSGVHRYGLEWRERLGSAFELGEWLRDQRELIFYREGSEAVVAVSETASGRFLSVNGTTEAGSGAGDVVTQKFIAHVPMLLHPDARRVLVIGWGAGATAASVALHPAVESVECVEIEPAVYEAAPLFAELGGALVEDPRFRIWFRDGRNHLLRARETWDVIVSEPSNPSISGVSNLFTREFYELVESRLAPGGIFGQSFHYYNLDAFDVRVEMKTFFTVFPHASLWLVPPLRAEDGTRSLGADMLLVGSIEPHGLDWARLVEMLGETPVGEDLRATRVLDDPLSLVATWAMSRAEMKRWVEAEEDFASPTPLNTDDHPYIELVAPRRMVMEPEDAADAAAAQYGAMSEAAGDARVILHGRLGSDAEASEIAALHRDLAERYIDAEQPQRALAALDAAADALPDDAAAHTRAAELLLERGRQPEALGRLRAAVRTDPDEVRAWDLLGQLAIDRQDYLLAESAHRAVLRREPANITAWLRLGAVLARQGKWDEARDALVWARLLDPEAPVDPELERYIDEKAKGIR